MRIASLLCLWLYGLSISAQTQAPASQNLAGLYATAQTVFIGTLKSSDHKSVSAGKHQLPATDLVFEISHRLKGLAEGQTQFTVRLFGAAPGTPGFPPHLNGLPGFHPGKAYLMFLHPPTYVGFFTPVGFQQGCFEIIDEGMNEPVLRNFRMNRGVLAGMEAMLAETNLAYLTKKKLLVQVNSGPASKAEELEAMIPLEQMLALIEMVAEAEQATPQN